MNTNEIIRERKDSTTAQPMAARVVAICEGCPLAKFCATKAVAPCETTEVRTQYIESTSGDYGGTVRDEPVQLSYRTQLLDDTIPIVMANLQKKKDLRPQPSRAKVTPPAATATSRMKSQAPKKMPKRATSREVAQVGSADILADILVSMIGVSSMTTARDKKKV